MKNTPNNDLSEEISKIISRRIYKVETTNLLDDTVNDLVELFEKYYDERKQEEKAEDLKEFVDLFK